MVKPRRADDLVNQLWVMIRSRLLHFDVTEQDADAIATDLLKSIQDAFGGEQLYIRRSPGDELSKSLAEVLALSAEGKTPAEIGLLLDCSRRYVYKLLAFERKRLKAEQRAPTRHLTSQARVDLERRLARAQERTRSSERPEEVTTALPLVHRIR